MENFGDNLPLPINLDHGQKVRIIRLGRIHLNLSLDNCRRRGNCNHVQVSFDLVALLALIQVIEQVGNGASLELPFDVAVDASVRMEPSLGTLGAALLHGIHVTVGRRDHGVVLGAGDLLGYCFSWLVCCSEEAGWMQSISLWSVGDLRAETPTLGIRALNASGRQIGCERGWKNVSARYPFLFGL